MERGGQDAAKFRLGVALSNERPLAETVALARRAEDLGFDEVWIPESSHGRSATSVVAVLTAKTNLVGLGVGVVNPFWRHPSLIAMEAATLDEASAGRVRIGLGAALWTLKALGEADSKTERPLAAMVEAVRVVKAMLSGEQGTDGEVFSVRSDARLDFEPVRRSVPVYVGAVNANMVRAAGQWADGLYLGALTTPGYAAWACALAAEGATRRGRDGSSFDICANVLVSVSRDGAAARQACRPVLAYYLHRVEGVVIDQSGCDPEQVAFVRATFKDHGAADAAARLPEELIDIFAVAGTPDQAWEHLNAYREAGVRCPLVWHVFGPDPDDGLRLLSQVASGATD